jgi:hypothetical protein
LRAYGLLKPNKANNLLTNYFAGRTNIYLRSQNS